MVPLSTTVHFSLATRLPISPANAEVCLAIEVGFQTVTDSFVQQHAGPSWTEHDFHLSGRSFARVELQDRLAGGFFGKIFWRLVAEEEIQRHATAAAGTAASGVAFRLGDAADVHARQRLRVFGEGAIGSDHQNVAQLVGIAGANFLDPRIDRRERLCRRA